MASRSWLSVCIAVAVIMTQPTTSDTADSEEAAISEQMEGCEDVALQCPHWIRHCAKGSPYELYMLQACAKTCGCPVRHTHAHLIRKRTTIEPAFDGGSKGKDTFFWLDPPSIHKTTELQAHSSEDASHLAQLDDPEMTDWAQSFVLGMSSFAALVFVVTLALAGYRRTHPSSQPTYQESHREAIEREPVFHNDNASNTHVDEVVSLADTPCSQEKQNLVHSDDEIQYQIPNDAPPS